MQHLLLLALPAVATCEPPPPVCYTAEECACVYCLGPVHKMANAPVRPFTCDGDWEVRLSGFYWKPCMDGLEYAILDRAEPDNNLTPVATKNWNRLIRARFDSPHFDWDFGFKWGVAYNTPCDGWDLGVLWTSFRGHAAAHLEVEPEDSQTLILLWSAFHSILGLDIATDVDSSWALKLNLIDIELGREFWTSPRFSVRPFIGLRIAEVDQDYALQHKGGGFFIPEKVNNFAELELDYFGVGVRGGMNFDWHLNCGFSIFGSLSPSIVYGAFDFDHDEYNRKAVAPFEKNRVLDTHNHFRASRATCDLALGLDWFGLLCNCTYGLGASLAWEQHLLYHFNQFFRVKSLDSDPLVSSNRQNSYDQRRGDLSLGGWTLSVRFDF